MTYEDFLSARIREARVDAGITSQEKLARQVGITSGAVGLWERAKMPFPGKYAELYRRLKKLLVRLGIQEGAFHLARHTFASWLAKENESIYKVQKLLGHKSLQHTARYAKLQVQDLIGPLAALDRMKAKR